MHLSKRTSELLSIPRYQILKVQKCETVKLLVNEEKQINPAMIQMD